MMRRMVMLLLLCGMLAIAGCGGGNDGAGGLNGAVTVEGTQVASSFSSDVTFTITYTNPFKSDMIGVPINYTVYVNGAVVDHQATNFNNSGIMSITYHVPKDVVESSVRCVANSANLIGSDSVTVAAFGVLNITPTTQTFAAGDAPGATKIYTISGGSGNYSVASSNPALVDVFATGATVTATKLANTATTSTVVLTVTDTTTGSSVQAQVIVTATP